MNRAKSEAEELDPMPPSVSLLLPVYNEKDSLRTLHGEISSVMGELGRDYEIWFVNDGSSDGTEEELDRLAAADPRVRVAHLRKNFGKSPALAAGFQRVQGDIIVTLDADLQDDPAMIPAFLELIDGGADVVSGWKKERHDPIGKTLPSKIFNSVLRSATGLPLHDFNCGFKAYTAESVRELNVYGGFHRFLPVLAAARGFRVQELVVSHRPRRFGKSKYGPFRIFSGLLDFLTVLLVTSFRTRPLHFFGLPGFVLGVLGFGILLYLTFLWTIGEPIGTRPLLSLGVLLSLTAAQFLCIGLLGELLVRSSISAGEVYSVRSEVGVPAAGREDEADA